MGGYGSGPNGYGSKKDTVEDCRTIDICYLARHGYIKNHRTNYASLTWNNSVTHEFLWRCDFYFDLTGWPKTVRLSYSVPRSYDGPFDKYEYTVQLTTTKPNFGGVRWWFVCPISGCGRRAGKLYRPSYSRYYGCRRCHDLTYTSCQESRKFDSLHKMLALQMLDSYPGITGRDVKRILSAKW